MLFSLESNVVFPKYSYLSEGNVRLYLKYLKMAAENGII